MTKQTYRARPQAKSEKEPKCVWEGGYRISSCHAPDWEQLEGSGPLFGVAKCRRCGGYREWGE
ncbi:hypothetical protein D8763_18595 [Proteus mirabilis]|nr:hypothetical protein [Proteus mirabilis]MVF43625.1 hypothetical protein [Proteus mirabilis]